MQLIFQGDSFDTLKQQVSEGYLQPGTQCIVLMDLIWPVGPSFDLAGAELLFGDVVPPGLELVDVRSQGWSQAIVEMRVSQPTSGVAAAPVAIGAVIAFIAAKWKILTLIAIGIAATLGLIVSFLRGFGSVMEFIAGTVGTLMNVGIAAAAVLGVAWVVRRFRERKA